MTDKNTGNGGKSSAGYSAVYEKTPQRLVLFLRWILYYFAGAPVFAAVNFLVFNLKVEGRRNLKGLHGAILISSHVHYIDCGMVGGAAFPRKVRFVSHTGNFTLPHYGWFVRQLGCIPIGESFHEKKIFLQQCTSVLEKGRFAAIYPEGDVELYSRTIHPFTSGAFLLAVNTDSPVVPFVFTQRPVRGIRKLWCRKPFFTLHIGEPMYPAREGSDRERIDGLKERAYDYFRKILADTHPEG